MVDGKVLYLDGRFMTLDRSETLRRAEAGAREMHRRLEKSN